MPSMSTSLDENKIEIKTEAPTGKVLKAFKILGIQPGIPKVFLDH